MNKRLRKKKESKLPKIQPISKEDVQSAWNIVADYLNKRPEFSFNISPWNKNDEGKYTLASCENGDILVANTEWEK